MFVLCGYYYWWCFVVGFYYFYCEVVVLCDMSRCYYVVWCVMCDDCVVGEYCDCICMLCGEVGIVDDCEYVELLFVCDGVYGIE